MPPPAPFATTLWSTILQARDADGVNRRAALDRLCARYWPPLYVYLQRRGLSKEDAQDAVQGFFAYFLEKGLLHDADPSRGRFRRYLLAVLDRWLANERRTAAAAKRGGGAPTLSLDFEGADRRLTGATGDAPDEAFRRMWALEVLREATGRLRREYAELGRSRRYEAFAARTAVGTRPSVDVVATNLGISPADVSRIVYEAQRRLQEIIRGILRDTVDSDAELEDEIKDLFER